MTEAERRAAIAAEKRALSVIDPYNEIPARDATPRADAKNAGGEKRRLAFPHERPLTQILDEASDELVVPAGPRVTPPRQYPAGDIDRWGGMSAVMSAKAAAAARDGKYRKGPDGGAKNTGELARALPGGSREIAWDKPGAQGTASGMKPQEAPAEAPMDLAALSARLDKDFGAAGEARAKEMGDQWAGKPNIPALTRMLSSFGSAPSGFDKAEWDSITQRLLAQGRESEPGDHRSSFDAYNDTIDMSDLAEPASELSTVKTAQGKPGMGDLSAQLDAFGDGEARAEQMGAEWAGQRPQISEALKKGGDLKDELARRYADRMYKLPE